MYASVQLNQIHTLGFCHYYIRILASNGAVLSTGKFPSYRKYKAFNE